MHTWKITWKVVLVAIILSTGVASARPHSDRAVADSASGEPTGDSSATAREGTVRAFQTSAKDKVLSLTISGPAAEMMFNMLAHGNGLPNVVPREKPAKVVSENGVHCRLSTDPHDPEPTYFCHFALTKKGISASYQYKVGEAGK